MKFSHKRLDELGSVSRGRSKHRPRNAPELYGGPYPFVQTADVKKAGLYLTEYSQTYSEKGLAQSKLWPKGTLCITIAANIADTAILGVDACFPDSVIGFIPDDSKSNVKYVKYLFDYTLQTEFKKFSQGAAQDNLSQEKLLSIKFPVPDIECQNRIAAILSDYDSAIDNARRQIALLEEAAMRLYREWFVVNADPMWEKKRIVDVCSRIGAGGTPNRRQEKYWLNGTIDWIKTKELQDCWLFDSEEKITSAGLDESSAKIYPANTVVMAIYASPTLGRLGILDKPMCCNQAALCLVADESQVSWEWLYCQLFELRDEFNRIARGAGQQNISGEVVKETVVHIPDIHAMSEFTNAARPLFSQCRSLGRQIRSLTEARNRLLPKLMSGEVEV